ncbi:YhbD family protein [Alicyclobacillus cycloheptanicus]|uniref:DNA-binding transcriptional MerR regulator n=1 Tax=Alicyclobacillus cycloheptanicus TaxID=1457 RepID=A0ABT9XHG1_9BACL|nr:YhbD family protein [Alicyclobacillus cycloheptanicus]MDQ0189744.1 DNA-binding transcriptional MerR regulator [Alicyclobacillus cycloheptanicus]WDM01953.1 YhbD family protein [Alicyclobacillus cycloheptanicus]
MDADLISKKELLELTGISYGQLYRWKRKNLIPEEWFIRKSTFTGQETFFPRDQILARIERIMSMKDDHSLDEIADQFSPTPTIFLSVSELLKRNIVTKPAIDLYLDVVPGAEALSFDEILFTYALDSLLRSGDINLDEGKIALRCLIHCFPAFAGKPCELFFARKLGVATCALLGGAGELAFEPDTKVVAIVHLGTLMEELKLKLL